MPGSLGRHVVDRLQTSAYQVVEKEVLPAFRRLQDFLQYEYRLDDILSMATNYPLYLSTKYRSQPGISSIPGGAEFYSAVLRWHISTEQSAHQVIS